MRIRHVAKYIVILAVVGVSSSCATSQVVGKKIKTAVDGGQVDSSGLGDAFNQDAGTMAKQLAEMSGGEYAPFVKEKAFEDRVEEVARHARNRYMLSFTPTDKTPGFHTLQVKLTQDYGARLVARASYWAAGDDAAPVPAAQ